MKISLSNNISKYRKERKMTQEELAEALGVTFAAVSKWERGIATPDISLIVQMADLFDVSLDALIGYNIENNKIDNLGKLISDCLLDEDYTKAIQITNNGLVKYPNNFKMVYYAGRLFYYLGIKLKTKEHYERCIELLNRSILLLNQNDDNEINEISIQGDIAQCYIELGQMDKGISLLKKYNVQGLYNSTIVYSITNKPGFNPKDVEPVLNTALISNMSDLFCLHMACGSYYRELKNYDKALESFSLAEELYTLFKINKNEDSFLDKFIAYIDAYCATVYYLKNNKEKAIDYLKRSYQIAIAYDENPIKTVKNIKLFTDVFTETIEDSLGKTAIDSIDNLLSNYKDILKIWEEIKEKKL